MSDTPNYIGKTPLLRPLDNITGQFFLFSQYSEDLTKYLGDNILKPVPNSFYCLNLHLPDTSAHEDDYINNEDPVEPNSNEVEQPILNLTQSNSNQLDPDSYLTEIAEMPNGVRCPEIVYRGNINIFGTDNIDGINYNEIYCHIDNDAKKKDFTVNLSGNYDALYGRNSIIGYGPEVVPVSYIFTNYSEYIGDILQNEYENGITFLKTNSFDIPWREEYSLGRLLYVLFKNDMIRFYNPNEAIIEPATTAPDSPLDPDPEKTYAGVLSNKSLFDDIQVSDVVRGVYRYFTTNDLTSVDADANKFEFNAVIVCYDLVDINGEYQGFEIPMGLYFTGFDTDHYTNTFTKYVKNHEIYNQGTSYTLRICTRTLSSQATETGIERLTEIISASNTGEWVNEYEFLMSKFDETYNILNSARANFADLNNNILENLQEFRNNRTNVPYVKQVGNKKYWFVNGVNTGVAVIEYSDYADWETEPIEPYFPSANVVGIDGENYTITPSGTNMYYKGLSASFEITPDADYKISTITYTVGESAISYSVDELSYDLNDTYNDFEHNISIRRAVVEGTVDVYDYVFTILDVENDCSVSATAEELQ